jgi:hypothetical protein
MRHENFRSYLLASALITATLTGFLFGTPEAHAQAAASSVQSLTELELQLTADLVALQQEELLVLKDLQTVMAAIENASSTGGTGTTGTGGTSTTGTGTGATNTSGTGTTRHYAGLYDRAPWGPVRPLDSIALVGTMLDINQSATACLPINCTGTPHLGAPFSRSYLFELNYGIGLLPGLTAKPYAAWSVQPFTQTNPAAHVENGVAVGVELTVVFEQLLNFPAFVPH